MEPRGELADVALDRRVLGDGDIVGPHDTLARVFDGEGERRLGDPHIDRREPGWPSVASSATRTRLKVTEGLNVARMPSVFHLPSVTRPGASAGTSAWSRALPMSASPSSAHHTM